MKRSSRFRGRRSLAALIVLTACLIFPAAEVSAADQPHYKVKAEYDVKVPMRDGVLLSTDVYRPDTSGRFPVILMRTPYNNFDPSTGYWFAERGYAVVLQDVRGKCDSDGRFYPLLNEARDGYDTQQWCAGQSWSDGKVGTFGGSYVGATQWLSSVLANDNLVCMFPFVAASDYYRNWVYNGGAFALSFNTMWGALSISARVGQDMTAEPLDWSELFRSLPVGEIPALLGRNVPWYADWLAHPTYDDYWKAISVARNYEKIKAPAFNVGGWYDVFIEGTLENFNGLRERGGSEQARRGSRLLVGPWFHPSAARTQLGQLEFGPAAAVDEQQLQLKWFDYWLKGIDNGLGSESPVRLFFMGENRYRDFDSWPPAGAVEKPLYLHSRKGANSLSGDGSLDWSAPVSDERVDTYIYDPLNPVPTLGGNDCCRETIVTQGPYDQRPVERRDDVLVFTSRALSEALTVAGPVRVKLWAASSAINTDWTAKLVDVYPDGRAINLTSAILRAPLRNGLENWEEITPDKAYEYILELRPTANVFLPGHCLRVEISSSNFPRYDRNLNTPGADISAKTEMVSASQQVYHDRQHPSRIILSVLE